MNMDQLDPAAKAKIQQLLQQAEKEKASQKKAAPEDITLKAKVCKVLNWTEDDKTLLQEDGIRKANPENRPLVSDADEQLLITYHWDENVSCKYLVVRASHPPKDDDTASA